MSRLWGRFARFTETGYSLLVVTEIDDEVVNAFVDARNTSGQPPSDATRQHRRSAVRLLFRIWRDLGLVESDPTVDIDLPSRRPTQARPLTEDEVERCRAASLKTPTATRQPAIWALAEAGAHSAEIPFVLCTHLRLDAGNVLIAGSTKTFGRSIPLTDWGAAQLRRRAGALSSPGASLCYEGSGGPGSAQASVSSGIGKILARAGVAGEDVTPRSVTAWVGKTVYEETCNIEDVARRLGIRSLDRAAALISLNWRIDE